MPGSAYGESTVFAGPDIGDGQTGRRFKEEDLRTPLRATLTGRLCLPRLAKLDFRAVLGLICKPGDIYRAFFIWAKATASPLHWEQ